MRNVIDAIITRRDLRIVMRVVLGIDRATGTAGEEAAGLMASLLFGALAGWLSGAREAGLSADEATTAELGPRITRHGPRPQGHAHRPHHRPP
ncbi:hypothetical protein ACFV1W_24335 [Kitasatospora sp. NPDC059648]|uniref:hypothetical protein n=1 Tax=Kitasatospora sp. NPDC059648 TaxID=3346894 RepID=UPI0036BE037B